MISLFIQHIRKLLNQFLVNLFFPSLINQIRPSGFLEELQVFTDVVLKNGHCFLLLRFFASLRMTGWFEIPGQARNDGSDKNYNATLLKN